MATFRGFPTRMVYLYSDIWSRYAILVGNPREGDISRVSDQNGLSLQWYVVEICHSGWKPQRGGHFEGFRPEWSISTVICGRDMPFWLETPERGTFRGFPTRMVYLYSDMWSRYAILVGNLREGDISRVSDQNGLSLQWYVVEICHSGWTPQRGGHFEGFRPEWSISTVICGRDMPFWLETSERGTFRGFPTRMVYLYSDMWSRYAILVGNPREGYISRVSDQNGLSLQWYVVEICHSGWKPQRGGHFEGFRPEWSISTVICGRDIPFWLETLDLCLKFRHGIYMYRERRKRKPLSVTGIFRQQTEMG